MAKQEKKIISIDWQALGNSILSVIQFLKWPATLLAITYLIVKIPDYGNDFKIDYRLVLEYIDVVIWPLVVIGALWFIKPNLPHLLDRLEELNLLGNKATFTKTQQQDASTTDTKADELKEIDPDAPKPATHTSNDLQIVDDETHALLTSSEAGEAFMQIYLDIFGSQIQALRRLLDYTDGLRPSDLNDILEKHRRLSGGKGFSNVVPFMQFLLQNTLALYEAKTQTYKLTNAGYYFLVYLAKNGLLDRPKEW